MSLRACLLFTILITTTPRHRGGGGLVNGKLCGPIEARNNVENLMGLNNCTTAVSITVLLMENTTAETFATISFPELREVLEYIVFFRINGIESIGRLFPNLTVIRAKELYLNNALIISSLPNLREIGLHKLMYVGGNVRVINTPKLCIDKVNWTKIIQAPSNLTDDDLVKNPDPTVAVRQKDCTECPAECRDGCWNSETCMAENNCHKECLSCYGPGDDQCYTCRSFKHDGRCVDRCPDSMIPCPFFGSCLRSENDCANLTDSHWKMHWFMFNGMCLNNCTEGYYRVPAEEGNCKRCGESCVKYCRGMEVIETKQLYRLTNCTIITGSLSIMLTSDPPESFLTTHLGKIEEIEGYLQVQKSNNIKSLKFLKNLRVIHGNDSFSDRQFVVSRNAMLEELWDDSHAIELKQGHILINDNPQLCRRRAAQLIAKMKERNGNVTSDMSNNGRYKACDPPIALNDHVVARGSTYVTIAWDDYKKFAANTTSQKTTSQNTTASVVIYLIHYLEKTDGELSWEENNCQAQGFQTLAVETNVGTLRKLKPYTTYAYFVKILSNVTSTEMIVSVTELNAFTTLPDDPSKVDKPHAISKTHDTIELTWDKPRQINGELAYFYVSLYRQRDDVQFIEKRNYCHVPFSAAAVKPKKRPTTTGGEPTKPAKDEARCDCERKEPSGDTTDAIELNEFEVLCTDKATASASCKKFMYTTTSDARPSSYYGNYTRSSVRESAIALVGEFEIAPDARKYVLRDLTHFTTYLIFMSACNRNDSRNDSRSPMCSEYVMMCQRTLRKLDADDIPGDVTVDVKDKTVSVHWREPTDPNALITSYDVKYKPADSENAQTVTDCVTRADHKRNRYVHTLNALSPGAYKLNVRAYSLAGGGRTSRSVEFKIDMEMAHTTIVLGVLLLFLAAAGIAVFVYYRHRRKRTSRNLHLITEVNPDYSENHYVVDEEWEIDRSDVEKLNELGQGSFGKVYSGFIKSKGIPCAIKSIEETASTHERLEFLNEAHVMKSFCMAYHVVKLLGIVSKSLPPLVIMELMERGDLKSFLRRSRDSSNNITCPEMYRMAAEIADGMYYLSTKKFVHRDLAARNCMVAADHTVKIGDFGMARDIYETDYYRKESRGLFPVRWMSPESLADGVFTTDSDVWSYGIVLWEMATLAEQPYQGLSNEQVLQFVISHGTLDRPKECPDLLWETMQFCWRWRPINRPTFGDIVAHLETYVGPGFRAVSFFHSRAGEESRLNASERVRTMLAQSSQPEQAENVVHWNASDDDDISLYSDSNRPTRYLSYPHQRQNRSSNKYNFDDSPNFDFN